MRHADVLAHLQKWKEGTGDGENPMIILFWGKNSLMICKCLPEEEAEEAGASLRVLNGYIWRKNDDDTKDDVLRKKEQDHQQRINRYLDSVKNETGRNFFSERPSALEWKVVAEGADMASYLEMELTEKEIKVSHEFLYPSARERHGLYGTDVMNALAFQGFQRPPVRAVDRQSMEEIVNHCNKAIDIHLHHQSFQRGPLLLHDSPLSTNLKERRFSLHDVQGNGDCFPAAILEGLRITTSNVLRPLDDTWDQIGLLVPSENNHDKAKLLRRIIAEKMAAAPAGTFSAQEFESIPVYKAGCAQYFPFLDGATKYISGEYASEWHIKGAALLGVDIAVWNFNHSDEDKVPVHQLFTDADCVIKSREQLLKEIEERRALPEARPLIELAYRDNHFMALVSEVNDDALDAPTSSFAKTIQNLLALEADSVAKEVEEDRKRAQKRATKRQKSVATSAASADTSGTSKGRGRGDSNGLTKNQRPPKNALKKRRTAKSTTSSDPVKKQRPPNNASKKRRKENSATSSDPVKKQKQSDIRSFFMRSDGPDLT